MRAQVGANSTVKGGKRASFVGCVEVTRTNRERAVYRTGIDGRGRILNRHRYKPAAKRECAWPPGRVSPENSKICSCILMAFEPLKFGTLHIYRQWRRQDFVPGGAQKSLGIYTKRLSTYNRCQTLYWPKYTEKIKLL